jgi:hypothetical protein
VNFLIAGRFHAQRNVFADAVAEQKCFLRHKANILAQGRQRKLPDRPAIEQNHPRSRVVNARNQIDQRALSRAGRTHDRHAAACRNSQVQVMQHALAVVLKIQPAEFDFPFYLAILARLVLDLRLFLQNLIQPHQRSRAPLENVDHPSQSDDGERELHHVDVECGERADLHAPGQHFAAADPQHQHQKPGQA